MNVTAIGGDDGFEEHLSIKKEKDLLVSSPMIAEKRVSIWELGTFLLPLQDGSDNNLMNGSTTRIYKRNPATI
jgi:hypothetical protein